MWARTFQMLKHRRKTQMFRSKSALWEEYYVDILGKVGFVKPGEFNASFQIKPWDCF